MKYLVSFEFEFEAESEAEADEFVSEIIEITHIDEMPEYLSRQVVARRKLENKGD